MRVAVFGGTGYVGSYLIDQLIAHDLHPVVLVRSGSEEKLRHRDKCTMITGDLDDAQAIATTVEGADAAVYSIGILRENPAQNITFKRLQLEGAKTVMDAAVQAGVNRFLLMSANGVASSATEYQRTKYQAENYLQTLPMDWTIFRPSVLFGDPRGRGEFATQLTRDLIQTPMPAPLFYSGLWPVKAGSFEMAPVHVNDVARALRIALQRSASVGRTLTLCGPARLSWKDILIQLATVAGKRKLMLPVPAWPVQAAATLLERFPAFPITRDQLSMLLEGNICSANNLTSMEIDPQPFNSETLQYLVKPS
jgi:NADH dehydrogenase